ncbi:peroxidase-related enzyme [Burkholderia seminalis]|uniref:peroxidase-related enzyme n=1 Tax=Burkholderia seminalis TaxID=488731 RepID=UPI00387E1183
MFGKYWYTEPILTPATSATSLVVNPAHPCVSRTRAPAVTITSTVARERAWRGAFRIAAAALLSRAERELASTAVSRVNGCVYCASVHAQRFAQLAKRTDAIEQVFDDPATAGTTARERAIIRYAIALTERPDAIGEGAVAALEAEGLTHEEILDLSHAIAIFAWANRLMLTLGEPVFPEPAAGA